MNRKRRKPKTKNPLMLTEIELGSLLLPWLKLAVTQAGNDGRPKGTRDVMNIGAGMMLKLRRSSRGNPSVVIYDKKKNIDKWIAEAEAKA